MKLAWVTACTIIIAAALTGCQWVTPAPVSALAPATGTVETAPPVTITFNPTSSPSPSATSEPTFTITASETPRPTDTVTPTPATSVTATFAYMTPLPESITAPILLYHHIKTNQDGLRYFVNPDVFKAQMQALKDWGYTSITVSDLVDGLVRGRVLPLRPVVITFDDGLLSVYENAFPIMQALGFVGTVYVVTDQLELDGYMSIDQLKELAAAGWEIGSHSRTHTAPDASPYGLRMEMEWTRTYLEQNLGVPVRTYSYPFGTANSYVKAKAEEYGYTAGVGLGILNEHTSGGIYYLQRREVQRSYTMKQFAALLPWSWEP